MSIYRFGEFELRADTGFLLRNGAEVPLQPQVLGLLIYLVENRDRIISKDELVDSLWDGRIVSDAALNTRLRDVRRALGDDGRQQGFVRTFPKRGVQFVAPLTPARGTGGAAHPPPRKPWRGGRAAVAALLLVAGVLVALFTLLPREAPVADRPDQPSIAILRFTADQAGDHAFLADGLAEELITDLSRFRELFVISRGTSLTFDPDAADPRQLRQDLGVEFVARGSVRTDGRDISVSAQLVETANGKVIWAERFDRRIGDIFAIQDDISNAISGRILPEMVRARVTANRDRPTDDLSAWDLLLQAKAHQTVFTGDGQQRAISLARAALARDPALSAAHSLIAQAQGNLFFWSDGDETTRDAALGAARRALALDPDDPMAHAALGYVYRFTGDEARAIGNLERAVALNPNNALIRLQYGHTLDWFRQQDRALPQIEMAIRLSPRDPLLQNMLFYKAHILYHLQRYEESLAATRAMAAVLSSGPWELFYHLMRAATLAELGRSDDAQDAIGAARALSPGLTLAAMKARFDKSRNHPDNRSIWLASLRKAGLPE